MGDVESAGNQGVVEHDAASAMGRRRDFAEHEPPRSLGRSRRARSVGPDATVAELVAALVEAGLMEPAEDAG